MGSYTLNLILDFVKEKEKNRINAIQTIYNNRKDSKYSNSKNIEIINEFLEYMRNNGSSEHHQNNNLKVVIAFSNFIGKDISFYDITKMVQILKYL